MRKKVLLLFVFAVAMGYLEAAVVVYLRELLYPEGFTFPIKQMTVHLGLIEIAREAATIVMLLGVAFVAEKNARGRLACFMLLFGLWDIAYYLWLWVTISWPPSLLTWDLLFLIPVIWTGPVITPLLVALLMIATASIYYRKREAAEALRISGGEWTAAVLAALVIFTAFALNHPRVFRGGVPTRFPWLIFFAGMAMGVVVLARITRKLISSA